MALVEAQPLASCSHTSLRIPNHHQPDSTTTSSPFHSSSRHVDLSAETETSFDDIELSSYLDGLHVEGINVLNTLDSMSAFGVHSNNSNEGLLAKSTMIAGPVVAHKIRPEDHGGTVQLGEPRSPFRKWMKTLHRRAQNRPRSLVTEGRHPRILGGSNSARQSAKGHHRELSAASSFGFVAAVRSASASIASASVVTRPRMNTGRSRAHSSKTERSSRASFAAARMSEDSRCEDRAVHDPMVAERSMRRRYLLEELISTEEGYIGDVRFLMNVYVTILASIPTLPAGLRSSINRNLTEIVELHEEILGDLHRVVPDSEYTQLDASLPSSTSATRGHRRWRSLDAVPEDKNAVSWLQAVPGVASEAQIAGDVAKVFSRKMDRFFIYEEYGAKYEMMMKDVASTNRKMPQWDAYQKGLEALACSLGSANSHGDQSRKSLTISDLLVKPIQRICKYPLLFSELLKYTPVTEDANSHMEVESALLRLREATAEINRATNDSQTRATLQKTWILQDRLIFSNQRIDAASRTRIRSFGHVALCGALHVCWQSKESVKGQYMVCLLYHDVLCLASAGKVDQLYTIEACINLNNIKVEEIDNGRGLQCHTAPFSWKLVFQCDSQLYEVIMTGCNLREQNEWRDRLHRPMLEGQAQTGRNFYSTLSLDIKSLGTVFGKPGTIARRISIHRATTVGPKSPLCQVILKNTSVARDGVSARPMNSTINRSQSLLATTSHRVPILAPHRGERARLEALLSDVWSREALPFPSMTTRSRSEHLVRSSASTMMRKLSVTSITSSFSKRSSSVASMTKLFGDDEAGEDAEGWKTSRLVKENRAATEQDPGTPELPVKATLPRIQDESERKSSVSTLSTTRLETANADKTRLGRQARAPKPEDGEDNGDASMADARAPSTETRALGASSANTTRLRRGRRDSVSPKSSTRPPLEEHGEGTDRVTKKPKLTHRSGTRWGRVGGLNRDSVVQGIRNFFR